MGGRRFSIASGPADRNRPLSAVPSPGHSPPVVTGSASRKSSSVIPSSDPAAQRSFPIKVRLARENVWGKPPVHPPLARVPRMRGRDAEKIHQELDVSRGHGVVTACLTSCPLSYLTPRPLAHRREYPSCTANSPRRTPDGPLATAVRRSRSLAASHVGVKKHPHRSLHMLGDDVLEPGVAG